jgi:hypothetical protein
MFSFESGFVLQAIVAMLLQWRMRAPAKAEMGRFFEKGRQSNQINLMQYRTIVAKSKA